jgi:hypothetical protein
VVPSFFLLDAAIRNATRLDKKVSSLQVPAIKSVCREGTNSKQTVVMKLNTQTSRSKNRRRAAEAPSIWDWTRYCEQLTRRDRKPGQVPSAKQGDFYCFCLSGGQDCQGRYVKCGNHSGLDDGPLHGPLKRKDQVRLQLHVGPGASCRRRVD